MRTRVQAKDFSVAEPVAALDSPLETNAMFYWTGIVP